GILARAVEHAAEVSRARAGGSMFKKQEESEWTRFSRALGGNQTPAPEAEPPAMDEPDESPTLVQMPPVEPEVYQAPPPPAPPVDPEPAWVPPAPATSV